MAMLENGLAGAMNARIIGEGSGPSIVLAHGYGGDQCAWDKIIPELAKHLRVIVFDWSFSGAVKEQELFDPDKYSTYDAFADDLICLLDELNLKSSIVFVGHSMSGMIGCIASIKRPELFQRLILVAASPRYINTDEYEGGFKKSEVDDIISSIETNFHSWAPAFASLGVDTKDPSSAEKFAASLGKMRPEVALALAKTVFYSDQRDILDKVTIPCTIVQTTSDRVVPHSVAYYMQQKIKGKTTVEIIDTDGHFPHLTAPEQLLDVFYGVLGLSS